MAVYMYIYTSNFINDFMTFGYMYKAPAVLESFKRIFI
jgi:hypothetical protein